MMCTLFIFFVLQCFVQMGVQSSSGHTNIPVNPIEKRRELYQLMKDVHEVFTKCNLQYWVSAGTLLGAIRHQAIIPWDYDLDTIVDKNDEQKLVKILYAFKELNKGYSCYGVVSWCGSWGYQIYFGDAHCDFMTYEKRNGIYASVPPVCFKSYYDEKDVFPLGKYKFGPIYVMGPNNPGPYLDLVYPNWLKEAVVYIGKTV